MIGVFLLLAAVVWFVLAIAIASLVTRPIAVPPLRLAAGTALFLVLLVLPVMDELLGKGQFEQLCKENSQVQVSHWAAGKTVYLAEVAPTELRGTWVPITLKRWRFVDVETRQPLVAYNTLYAKGGWLSRKLQIPEAPLTFKNSCLPKNRPASAQGFRALGINYIERPKKDRGEGENQ